MHEGKVSKLTVDLTHATKEAASLSTSLQTAEQDLREHTSRLSQVYHTPTRVNDQLKNFVLGTKVTAFRCTAYDAMHFTQVLH